jgi:hypothetical protein
MTKPDQRETAAHAVGSPLDCGVGPCAWADAYGEPSKTSDEQYRWPLYDQAGLDAAVAAERERWERAAEAMAQEADHRFTMDGTTAHWLRALVAKRVA